MDVDGGTEDDLGGLETGLTGNVSAEGGEEGPVPGGGEAGGVGEAGCGFGAGDVGGADAVDGVGELCNAVF